MLSLALSLEQLALKPEPRRASDAVRVSHSLRVLSSPPERKSVGESELTYLTTWLGLGLGVRVRG